MQFRGTGDITHHMAEQGCGVDYSLPLGHLAAVFVIHLSCVGIRKNLVRLSDALELWEMTVSNAKQ